MSIPNNNNGFGTMYTSPFKNKFFTVNPPVLNLDKVNAGAVVTQDLVASNIAGLGAIFDISSARATTVQNTKTASSSVVGYTFLNSLSVLTPTVPTETQALAAANLVGDVYQQLINDLRACNSLNELGAVYKNIIISLAITLVRVMFELGQVVTINDIPGRSATYNQAAAALSVINRFNLATPTGPLAPVQTVIIPAVDALLELIAQRRTAAAQAAAALLPGIILAQVGNVITALAAPGNVIGGTGGIGTSTSDKTTFMQNLLLAATSTTTSTLNAMVALTEQVKPNWTHISEF
jgi:hypothetical protein